MLGVIIGDDTYPVIGARKLKAECDRLGLDTSWWEESANLIDLVGGLGPSEAHLLLPYSVVKLLNNSDPSEEHGDDEGLDLDGSVNVVGANYYDRVIRIFQCIKENPSFDPEEEESGSNPKFITESQDLKGWTFVGSQAVDPTRQSTDDNTVHLVRFVNTIQGLSEIIGGTRSSNRNSVTTWNTNNTDLDAWGFFIGDPSSLWINTMESMWLDVSRHLPNEKYFDEPETFVYPEFPEEEGEDYYNNRPHNLDFKDLTPWEAFVAFCHKISHEIFPKFDGTFQVLTIEAHANESTDWASDTAYRPLELQMGEDLYARVRYLLDHDHPPASVLVPHSFTAVFSRTTVTTEVLAVPPLALWRGPGHTSVVGGLLPIGETGLFTQLLVEDSDVFDADFLEDHPYVMAGDYYDKNGTDRAARSRTQYIDCTFFAMLSTGDESNLQNIDLADDGLRHPSAANYSYPLPDIANLIAKRHLKAILMGDLGSVTLSGFHNFEPNTRHQTVRFDAGIAGPTTQLIGHYSPGEIFPRKVTTRNLNTDDDFVGLAVVVTTTPTDYTEAADLEPTGASGDFLTFNQGSFAGQALPLTRNENNDLVPDVPPGTVDSSPYLVDFDVVRDDTIIRPGVIVFIRNRIAHAISACDYIRGVNTGSVDTATDHVLVRQADGTIVWATAEDFEGPEGPTGGGTGDSVAPGYAIDTTGTPKVIDWDPTEITDFGAAFQFLMHYSDAAVKEDVLFLTVDSYDDTKDQMWWHKEGSFKFQTTDDYAEAKMQLLVNMTDDWKWIETKDYDDAIEQFLWHRADAGAQKRWEWHTTSDYATNKTQLLLNVSNNWSWKEVAPVNVQVPTDYALVIDGGQLKLKVQWTEYTFYGKPTGNSGEDVSAIDLVLCST